MSEELSVIVVSSCTVVSIYGLSCVAYIILGPYFEVWYGRLQDFQRARYHRVRERERQRKQALEDRERAKDAEQIERNKRE